MCEKKCRSGAVSKIVKNQRGMTLLEIIIVLGIIGTIAAGVVILAQRAYDSKALTDLASNTNTVRTAIKEAYGPSGVYPPAKSAAALKLSNSNIQLEGANSPIGRLVLLGKLSASEAKNNISNNFFNVGAAKIGNTGLQKGYFIEINGLDQRQCRNLLTSIGNEFDFVSVVNGAPSGTYKTAAALDLSASTSGIAAAAAAAAGGGGGGGALPTPATINAPQGIYRSLANNGSNILTPDGAIRACEASSANAIVLGSR